MEGLVRSRPVYAEDEILDMESRTFWALKEREIATPGEFFFGGGRE
jgi:hypothetical protein